MWEFMCNIKKTTTKANEIICYIPQVNICLYHDGFICVYLKETIYNFFTIIKPVVHTTKEPSG